jgi:photosynthetic reaction center H subunit
MTAGAITNHIDVAQVVLYAFWVFFALLVIYLRREDRREGYPLRSERSGRAEVPGFVAIPSPKTFRLFHGGVETVPRRDRDTRPLSAVPVDSWGGSPLMPTGNPMLDGVGPASWVERSNTPDLTVEGLTRIVPLRIASGFSIDESDPDPRGMRVVGADGVVGGVVRDVWVDRSEALIRYLEVELPGPEGIVKHVLLPMTFAQVDGRRKRVRVVSIMGNQFEAAPALANPDSVTLREEDKIAAYYGGGILYAVPSRREPLL